MLVEEFKASVRAEIKLHLDWQKVSDLKLDAMLSADHALMHKKVVSATCHILSRSISRVTIVVNSRLN